MNCSGFQKHIHALAAAHTSAHTSERLMDAAERADALRHVGQCSRCSATLADARALMAGLQSLAAADEGVEAPVRVESALLAAFRQNASQMTPLSHISPESRPLRTRARSWALVAVAACLLLLFGFVVWRATPANKKDQTPDEAAIKDPPPTPKVKIGKESVPIEPASEKAMTTDGGRRRIRKPKVEAIDKPFIQDEITAYAEDTTLASDFIPIDYNQNLAPMQTGQVIRVQMPRPLLARFGAPVSVEKVDVPVMADLLLGEDGIARAIRFVR
jgi:hypothetical protein